MITERLVLTTEPSRTSQSHAQLFNELNMFKTEQNINPNQPERGTNRFRTAVLWIFAGNLIATTAYQMPTEQFLHIFGLFLAKKDVLLLYNTFSSVSHGGKIMHVCCRADERLTISSGYNRKKKKHVLLRLEWYWALYVCALNSKNKYCTHVMLMRCHRVFMQVT